MNAKYVREEILKKNMPEPYFVDNTIYMINNDYDVFPYPRWFRGNVKSDKPVVAEREAGWVPKAKFKPEIPKDEIKKLTTCFQNPCSVVYPCYAPETNYISSNKVCTIENR
jgi:hypothetical protein